MVCLMCSIGALAQEAYAVFTEADSTLTFFYDELRTTVGSRTVKIFPGWCSTPHLLPFVPLPRAVGLATCGSLHLLMELHI